MLHIFEHALEHTIADTLGLLPFLFLTYLVMELMEHYAGNKFNKIIQNSGKWGPFLGATLGVMPQCGFSAAAASFFSARIIGVGTIIAVFLSTSDEMLPILLSESVPITTIAKILATKVVIACASGYLASFVYQQFLQKKEGEMDIHLVCEEEECNCEDGVLKSALKHTAKIFIYIFMIAFILNAVIEGVGEEALAQVCSNVPVAGQMVASLVGLIPNCASSVVITQLYLKRVISAGMMMSGLLVNAGIGSIVLFRLNRNVKQNVGILTAVYCFGVVWGIMIDVLGIVF
ncbi:MAG: arsenic efflux protein [Lachnospiraceae bacterium]|nr:arsenic efflux protein [Lachnospiraceae bacterium]